MRAHLILTDLGRPLPQAARLRAALGAVVGNQSGASAVEMALSLPFVLAAIMIALELSSVVYSQAELGYALSRTTRYSIIMATADEAQITARLRNQFMLLDPGNLASVAVSESANTDHTRTATVTVAYRHTFILPMLPIESVMLTRSQTFLRNG